MKFTGLDRSMETAGVLEHFGSQMASSKLWSVIAIGEKSQMGGLAWRHQKLHSPESVCKPDS